MNTITAKFVKEITVKDPDSGGDVKLEVWKDTSSGGLFALTILAPPRLSVDVPVQSGRHAGPAGV